LFRVVLPPLPPPPGLYVPSITGVWVLVQCTTSNTPVIAGTYIPGGGGGGVVAREQTQALVK